MSIPLEDKLKTLPRSPGVYLHKSKTGEIIYVGKAAVLKNRVRQYFQSSRGFDVKTLALVKEIHDTDWLETDSEIDALFLESEMVKRYKPRYNILLRDDKSQLFVRIDMKSLWPHVSFTRNPGGDGAEYVGPFYNGVALKKALRYLRRIFPYLTKPIEKQQSKLDEDLGLSPKLDEGPDVYKRNLRKLISYIKGNRIKLVREMEDMMRQAAKSHDYERAVLYRNKITAMNELQRRVMFGDREFLDISKDRALNDLTELLSLDRAPYRIEGYDISHMGGTNVVASMVVFANGVSDRAEYRKFKTRIEQNNDFYNMQETIQRRFSSKNINSWGRPDLVVIDGGKGQLDAAIQARNASDNTTVPFIGLAKKQEQIVIHHKYSHVQLNKEKLALIDGYVTISQDFTLINLPQTSDITRLLQRIRDESHRFAVSYHSVLKRRKQTASMLDEIPGIGPVTRKKLISRFGSLRAIRAKSEAEVADVIGIDKAKKVKQYIY